MANRFSIGGAPGPTKAEKDFRDREARLAERKADPGYQFLNAGLSTLASTLGNLAVNAAGYELFGGRKRDNLAQDDFKFRQQKFKDELDLNDRQLQFNKNKEQFANTKAAADATTQALAARSFAMEKPALDAAFSAFTGPKTRVVEHEQTQEPKPAVNVVQIPGGGPAYEVSDPETADFGYEGKHYKNLAEGEVPPGNEITLPLERKMVQREEAIDYYEGLSDSDRQDAQFLSRGLTGLTTALQKLPDGPQKDALVSSYVVSLGLSKGSADFLRDTSRMDGGSVSASATQLSTKRALPRGQSGRAGGAPPDWTKRQASAAYKGILYADFYNAVQNPNAPESAKILGDTAGNPRAQKRKLARLKKDAEGAYKGMGRYQKPKEIGGAIIQAPTERNLKDYSEGAALGEDQGADARAARIKKKEQWKLNPSVANQQSAASLSEFSDGELANLGMSSTEIDSLRDSSPGNEGNRVAVYDKYRGKLNRNQKGRLFNNAIARDARKGGGGRGTGRGKAPKAAWYSKRFENSFNSLKSLDSAGINTDKEFANNGFWHDATQEIGEADMRGLIKSAVGSNMDLATFKAQVEAELKKRGR